MKLLLHICCGPCSIYPFEVLEKEGFSVIAGFFYNPNVHPYGEYIARKSTMEDYARKRGFRVFFHKYDMKNFFRNICGSEEHGARCKICWRMRLEEAARFASQNGYTHFTTTLLVSPYQDQKEVRKTGEVAAKKYGVEFISRDFRDGFRLAQDKAKDEGMYRQKYCGCLFSEQERRKKVTKRVK